MVYRILICLLLYSLPAFSYTVIRKDGRPFSGDLISQTSDKIVVEDRRGIQVSFRVDQLDMDRTRAANSAESSEPQTAPTKFPATELSTQQRSSKYTGELITVDFKDIDIKDFFRFIAEISGMNLILDPAVKGSVTIKLTEVPWDQALDLVCRTNKLGYEIDGKVMSVK